MSCTAASGEPSDAVVAMLDPLGFDADSELVDAVIESLVGFGHEAAATVDTVGP